MAASADLAARLTQLQKDQAAADRERAQAEAALDHAKREQAQVEEELKALGVEPAKAEETLQALEAELATKLAQFEQQVAAERAAYAAIVKAASVR